MQNPAVVGAKIRASKEVAYGAFDLPDLACALDMDNFPISHAVMQSWDAIEGKRAFLERRAPCWTGT
mgnify:CR=1 FL=1